MTKELLLSISLLLVLHIIIFGSLNPFCIPKFIYILVRWTWFKALK